MNSASITIGCSIVLLLALTLLLASAACEPSGHEAAEITGSGDRVVESKSPPGIGPHTDESTVNARH